MELAKGGTERAAALCAGRTNSARKMFSQLCPDDNKGKPNSGFDEGAVDTLTFFVALRDLANPRSLAINFSSIGAMSFGASTGLPTSFARTSA